MKTGIELIATERKRQISKEGWTASHDDTHEYGELAIAATCYAINGQGSESLLPPCDWPWEKKWWKPSPDQIRNLVKAGALIAAEIDRLQRIPVVKG